MTAVVDQVLKNWRRPDTLHPVVADFHVDGVLWPISFVAYDSRRLQFDAPRDNCVATPFDKLVQCDLKIVDDLIAEFKLLEYEKVSRTAEETSRARNYFRKGLLTWILAHEIGHVVLRHGLSDYEDPKDVSPVFDPVKQREELAADAFAVKMIGSLNDVKSDAYALPLDVANSLIDKAVCPEVWPDVCEAMPPGVGLIYDYTSKSGPLKISLGGTHPAFVARFLRIIYLGGLGTDRNDINHEAQEVIGQLQIQTATGAWEELKDAFK